MGTWQWDISSDHVVWSEGVFDLHGRQPENFEGTVESALADAHPDDRDAVARAIQATLQEGAPFQAEYRCVRPDGRTVWLESKARCIRDGEGKPQRLVGVCMDITRRKQREQDHARVASIVASSTDAIIGKTVAGIVTSWNVGAERLFGYSAGEMIGQSIEVIVPRSGAMRCARFSTRLRAVSVCGALRPCACARTGNGSIYRSASARSAMPTVGSWRR